MTVKLLKLAYCDYIADRIKKALTDDSSKVSTFVGEVGKIDWDLHPQEGYMLSTKKHITTWDINGKAYSITIEEAPVLDKEVDNA